MWTCIWHVSPLITATKSQLSQLCYHGPILLFRKIRWSTDSFKKYDIIIIITIMQCGCKNHYLLYSKIDNTHTQLVIGELGLRNVIWPFRCLIKHCFRRVVSSCCMAISMKSCRSMGRCLIPYKRSTWASRQPGKSADTQAADVLRNDDMGEMFQNAEHIQHDTRNA